MKIKQANLYVARIPLKKPFKHGAFERTYNETVFLKISDGNFIGYGEALPRGYVTGESIEDIVQNLKKYISKLPKRFANLKGIKKFLSECEPEDSKNMASLCCLDLALLDLYGKNKDKSLREILSYELSYKIVREPRVTSGPLDLDDSNLKKDFYSIIGLRDIKLKINPETSPEKINELFKGLKPKTLRLDGNCSLTKKQLEKILQGVRIPISYIEQPSKIGTEYKIKGHQIMADESLISIKDSKTINFDSANIRIGKNGGVLRTLDVIDNWVNRRKDYMLGSLVGESSLLSSALLHLASITNPVLIEGCYSNRVLIKDPADIHPSVSYKGKIKFNYSTPGLGVNLNLSEPAKKIKLI